MSRPEHQPQPHHECPDALSRPSQLLLGRHFHRPRYTCPWPCQPDKSILLHPSGPGRQCEANRFWWFLQFWQDPASIPSSWSSPWQEFRPLHQAALGGPHRQQGSIQHERRAGPRCPVFEATPLPMPTREWMSRFDPWSDEVKSLPSYTRPLARVLSFLPR